MIGIRYVVYTSNSKGTSSEGGGRFKKVTNKGSGRIESIPEQRLEQHEGNQRCLIILGVKAKRDRIS